jgi:uncharacterized LabA/DUF88 family protein
MDYYVFIDGAYLRAAHEDVMRAFYGVVPPINFRDMSSTFLGHPARIYYYDAVDRNRVGSESEAERDQRVKERDDFHAYLNSLPRWSVREGFVSRGRRASRRSQKAVDVQLAVDALEHAANRSMQRAGFIFGDLDFEPLLFSLGRFAVKTDVWFERESASPELLEAADERHMLTVKDFWSMAPPDFQAQTRFPQFHMSHTMPDSHDLPILRTGWWHGRPVELMRENSGGHQVYAKAGVHPVRDPSFLVHFPDADPDRAVLAFTITFGAIDWD